MLTIATHRSIDLDAALSAWLVREYIFGGNAFVFFIGSDEEANDPRRSFDAVTDIGGVHDLATLRFDHHQFPAHENTSAAMLVYYAMRRTAPMTTSTAILPLVQLVHDADLGKRTPEVLASRSVGLHALFAAKKAALRNDEALFAWAAEQFTMLVEGERRRLDAEAKVNDCLRYQGAGIIGIEGGNAATTAAAIEAFPDAALIVYVGEAFEDDHGRMVYPWGIKRGLGGAGISIKELVEDYLAEPTSDAVAAELSRLFLHPAGWVALSGSGKRDNPTDYVPLGAETGVGIEDICEALEIYLEGEE